jgi:lipopolysaccharide biosynthesis glycosyltransferase|tara:strand:+ start:55 stop:732 length:678 start_codon:yes stop_codon:yes gene_type:complete
MKVFIGYDTREDIAYQVCKHSLESRNKDVKVIPLIQHTLRKQGWYTRPIDKLASTEFTFTRFLIPELTNFNGWALFCDSDIIFLNDVKELFDQVDDKYAVMCVKHDYTPKEGTKMDGQTQTVYPRKNWSSVMLVNCSHSSNKKLNTALVNNESITGAYLHRFSWLNDDEIGEFSYEWNYLTDWYIEGTPKALHYTEGGPWFENYRDCPFNRVWKKELQDMMQIVS